MIFISFEKECFNDTVLDLRAVGKLTEVKVPPEIILKCVIALCMMKTIQRNIKSSFPANRILRK